MKTWYAPDTTLYLCPAKFQPVPVPTRAVSVCNDNRVIRKLGSKPDGREGAVRDSKDTVSDTVSVVFDGATKGNVPGAVSKNTTTTEALELGSVEKTSKYHKSYADALIGWTFGALRPVAPDMN